MKQRQTNYVGIILILLGGVALLNGALGACSAGILGSGACGRAG